MKIIIAGIGKIGSNLIKELSKEGHELSIIDTNYDILAKMVEEYDVMTIQGNCASVKTLDEAGIKDADILITATNSDELNLLSCMTGHAINSSVYTIARVRNPEYSHEGFQMSDLLALSLTVNPDQQAAQEIEQLIKYPGFLKRDMFAKGNAEIVELRIDKENILCNKSLKDIRSIIHCKILVCAVLRDGKAIAPDGSFTLKEGDRIYVTAAKNELTTLLKNLGILAKRGKKVMICGGSRISYYLAQKLSDLGMEIYLIEKDYDKCVQMAQLLPKVCVIHKDASDHQTLQDEQIETFDSVVSLTGLDEVNIMISLYADKYGVRQVVTKLGHLENSNILSYLPLKSIINPKESCSMSIVRYIRSLYNQAGAALSVHRIADGKIEALEFIVDENTKYCNVPLKDLPLRKNVLLCCICKGTRTEIPSGNSFFEKDDMVIVVNSGNRVIYQLNDIFEE